MSEQGGYDPFSDDQRPKAVSESPVIHDPMEELLSGTHDAVESSSGFGDDSAAAANSGAPFAGQDDGWAPVEEEGFTLSQAMSADADPLAETLDEVAAPADIQYGSGVFEVAPPTHTNLLPVGDVETQPLEAPEAPRARAPRSPIHAPDSNEAILQSGVSSAASPGSSRASLPTREDAPPLPAMTEDQVAAWAVPTAVGVLGSAAGVYVLLGSNAILGGIFVGLSVVGALFLRLLLRD